MYSPIYTLLALVLPAICFADKVNVTVYYESLCPDSQRFFKDQLYPASLTPLLSNMALTLVPFGNANVSANGLQCQHGPTECYGNRVQACAIEKVSSIETQMGFINCLMKMAYENKPANETIYKDLIKTCGNWTADATNDIEKCADNMTESDPLMYKYGNMTKKADPPIKGVPTTFFNGLSSKEINDAASKDFPKTLCGYISGSKPTECHSGKGSASDIVSSIALVITAVVLSRLH